MYANYDLPEDTAALDPSPLAMVLNLRGQAEKQSRTQNMYDKRVGGWLAWDDVQQCRVKAVQQLASCAPNDRRARLRDATAISLSSLIIVAWKSNPTTSASASASASGRGPGRSR